MDSTRPDSPDPSSPLRSSFHSPGECRTGKTVSFGPVNITVQTPSDDEDEVDPVGFRLLDLGDEDDERADPVKAEKGEYPVCHRIFS